MDSLTFLLLLSPLLLVWLFSHLSSNKRNGKLPPGPPPLPIIGNIHQLGRNPHRAAAKLSETYGPLMHLKLGSVDTIIVSSAEMAKEVLQKHDQICSGRRVPCVVEQLGVNKASIIWLQPGSKWRKYRKVSKERLFATAQLQASESLRREKLRQMRDYLQDCCARRRAVSVEEVAFVTTVNLMSAMLFSLDFAGFDSDSDSDSAGEMKEIDSDSAREMKEIIRGVAQNLVAPNISDLFPVLKAIDPQGVKRRTEFHSGRMLAKFDEIIKNRLRSSSDSPKKHDMLQVLLDLYRENDPDFKLNDIKNILFDLVGAGTSTTAETVEWAMAELLHAPEKMWKVKHELMTMVGDEGKQVEESDLPKLPYLRAVVKETLRCHMPGPFLAPHKAEVDVEIGGYIIPKHAQILVNAWAICRDSTKWSNPNSFEPERFLDTKIDYKGHDFEFLPFGSGRRMCPGLPLADLMVHLMLATMIRNFDWNLEPGMKPEDVDLDDVLGLSLKKAVPLRAVLVATSPTNNL